jgi:hypothetical protein
MQMFKIICILIASILCHFCNIFSYIPDENATIYLTAIPAHIESGASSIIQVMGEKESGYPLPDGTIVNLFASSGQIECEITLSNGRAQATYASDSEFIGDVNITAHSGQAAISPEQLVITVSEIVEPDIAYLYISANPMDLPKEGGKSSINVLAFDEGMVPVSGKNIWLETTAGSLSGNGIYTTGSKGEVEAKLTTDRTATVTAKYKDLSNSVTITVEE